MRTLSISGIFIVLVAALAQTPNRRTIQTTDGQTLQGQVLSEGMTDLQLRTDDKKIICCARPTATVSRGHVADRLAHL